MKNRNDTRHHPWQLGPFFSAHQCALMKSVEANMNKYVLSSERKYPNGVMDDAHE